MEINFVIVAIVAICVFVISTLVTSYKRTEKKIKDIVYSNKEPTNIDNCIVNSWVFSNKISLKMQTVLLLGLRGCDGLSKVDVTKNIIRQVRGLVLKNAGTNNTSFIDNFDSNKFIKDIGEFCDDIDKYPIHFVAHMTHTIEIIGYKHPNLEIGKTFCKAYVTIVKSLHMKPEDEERMDERLADGVDTLKPSEMIDFTDREIEKLYSRTTRLGYTD